MFDASDSVNSIDTLALPRLTVFAQLISCSFKEPLRRLSILEDDAGASPKPLKPLELDFNLLLVLANKVKKCFARRCFLCAKIRVREVSERNSSRGGPPRFGLRTSYRRLTMSHRRGRLARMIPAPVRLLLSSRVCRHIYRIFTYVPPLRSSVDLARGAWLPRRRRPTTARRREGWELAWKLAANCAPCRDKQSHGVCYIA